MPKNKTGGKKGKKGKNSNVPVARELLFKDSDQDYALVQKMLGGGRLEAQIQSNVPLDSGKVVQCHIRGKLTKRDWISVGDLILISVRTFQDGKGDVIHKYTAEEGRKLKQMGELPDNFVQQQNLTEGDGDLDEDEGLEFVDIDDL